MSSEKKHSPQHDELLKKKALEQQEVKEVLVFFQKYAKPALTALLVVCVVAVIVNISKNQKIRKQAEAGSALLEARTADDLQVVVDKYSKTTAGPMALMSLAREKFNANEIDEAEALYNRFLEENSDHELAIQAELNLIACKETKGQLGEAHLLYGEFAKEHARSFLAPAALLGKARCLEAVGLLDEAVMAYDDILVNYPEGSWAQTADANKKVVLSKKQ